MLRIPALLLTTLTLGAIPISYLVTGGRAGTRLIIALGFAPDADERAEGSAARALLAKQPLNANALFQLAQEKASSGDLQAAEALTTRAMRHDPRHNGARLWMAQRYLTTGRVDAGVRELASLSRIRHTVGGAVASLLGEAARDPRARASISRAFAGRGELVQIASSAAAGGLSASDVLAMVRGVDFASLPGGLPSAQTTLVTPYIQKGKIDAAYMVWKALLPRPAPDLLYNGSFDQAEAAPPFAWDLTRDAEVQSTIVKAQAPSVTSALRVEPFANYPAQAAKQEVVVPPGLYALSFLARRDTAGASTGDFRLRVECDGKLASEYPLAQDSPAWTEHKWRIAIPQGCGRTALRLIAMSTSTSGGDAVELTSFRLRPLA